MKRVRLALAAGAVLTAAVLGTGTAPAYADTATPTSCSGPSNSTGSDTLAGPVYGNVTLGYAGAQTSYGYVEVNSTGGYPMTPVVQGAAPAEGVSARAALDGSGACLQAAGQSITG